MKFFGSIAAIGLFTAVSLGAFAAHALKNQLSAEMLAVFDTAVKYHFYHALALLFVAFLADRGAFFRYAGYLYIAGILLFSGSLYVLAVTEMKKLGMITPLGGLSFLAGHICLLIGFLKTS